MVNSTEEKKKSSHIENIWKIPGMQSAWYYTAITYSTIKDSNSASWAINSIKQTVQKTLDQTTPVADTVLTSLVKPIALADQTLWNGFSIIKVYLPLVTEAPWKIHQAIEPTLRTINNAKDFSAQMSKDICNYSWAKANELPGVCYTFYRPISSNVGQMIVHDIVPMLYNRQQINDIWSMLMTRYIQAAVGGLNTNKNMFPKLEARFVFIPFPGIRMAMYFSLSCNFNEFPERK